MADGAIPALDATQAVLASVRDQGGERFDAAGWHYLETLARRAAAREGRVQHMLEAKLAQALAVFAERFEQARSDAAKLLATACEKHPQAGTELQRLFAGSDFRGLRHFVATLEAREQCAALSTLVSQLESAVTAAPGHPPAQHATSHATTVVSPTLELKTVRESRATWARLSVDKQLALAMKQAPMNAGPINSHMLVLRSLAMMQEISPDYLSRMVSYVDTLLLLDPGEMEVPVKRKKAAPAKAAKPTKATKK
jgi:hypothetical protein